MVKIKTKKKKKKANSAEQILLVAKLLPETVREEPASVHA